MVEFGLAIPIVLLLTMIALDFGRVYLGWINLQNMVRVAGNFAANNPDAWADNDTETLTKYQNQIAADAAATNCQLKGGAAPAPTFSDANGDGTVNGVGDNATVSLTCSFGLITPIVSGIVGSSGLLDVSSSVVFPVKAGMTGTGVSGGGCTLPPSAAIYASPSTTGPTPFDVTFTDASGGCPATAWLWDFGDGSPTSAAQDPGLHTYTAEQVYTVTLTASNSYGSSQATETITVTSAPPPDLCTVPSFDGVRRNNAQSLWGTPSPPGAGFTSTVQDGPGAPSGNYIIRSQSLVAGGDVPCDSTITVNNP